jgi:hypothetical protein
MYILLSTASSFGTLNRIMENIWKDQFEAVMLTGKTNKLYICPRVG